MNKIARKVSIFVLMTAAVALTTALTIGTKTTLAASNTHAHDIQLMVKMIAGLAALPTHQLIGLVMSVMATLAASTLHSMDGVTHTSIIVQQI